MKVQHPSENERQVVCQLALQFVPWAADPTGEWSDAPNAKKPRHGGGENRGQGRDGLGQRSRGSILLLAVVLLSVLSVLFLLVANSVLLGTKAREALQASLEMLYIAEAGLAHGQAFCAAHGENSSLLASETGEEGEATESKIESPFGRWLPFGRGEYRIQVFRLATDVQPFLDKDSGILLVTSARLDGEGRRRACLLLDDPPSCRAVAWWEPD